MENENKKSKILYIIIGCLFLLVAGTMLGYYIFDKYDIQIGTNKTSNNQEIELKYTSTSKVESEGVYITDVSDVVEEVMPSIVAITSKTVISSGRFGFNYYGGSYTQEGAGSGVIVAEDDNYIYILTNYHVVENASELSVQFIDEKSYDAKIKGTSKNSDIAIVEVSKNSLSNETLESIKIATLGNSNELKVGNGIIAIGNALGYGQSVTTGVISALNREVTTDESTSEMIQIDAAINGGNSGGALLNSKGEVIGINTAKYSSNASSTSVEGMGFAIPISDIEEEIKSLIDGKEIESLTLGIEGYMTTDQRNSYNMPEGFYVSSIIKGGNADNSDLEIGNIITEIDGKEVTSVNTIKKVLNKKKRGESVSIKVKYVSKNEYKEKEITITLN